MSKVLTINVLAAFHTSKPPSMPNLYHWKSGDTAILLDLPAADFVRENADGLILVANYFWARFLGRLNYAPKIIDKLERPIPKRATLAAFARLLTQLGETSCFYCSKALGPLAPINIDHFIPWTFVFEDKLWNLVPACAACNSEKSDKLPDEILLHKLIRVNRTRRADTRPLVVSLLHKYALDDSPLEELFRMAIASEWPRFWLPNAYIHGC